MTVYGLIAACTHQRFQLLSQHAAHAHRVHRYQIGEHLAELTAQVLTVLLHLPDKVLTGKQRVETRVGRCVNVGWQVLRHIVHSIRQQFFIQMVENVTNALAHRVVLL